MYSVVLLVALSGSADAPALGGGCNGLFGSCHGCSGSCSGCDGNKLFGGMQLFGGKGCCGGSCHGCSGSCHGGWKSHKSCSGCTGSSCNGCSGGLFHKLKDRMNSCHGCNGGHSCHGGHSCTGCTGGHAAIIETAPAMPKADAGAPASIVVSLPAEAKLSIDGNETSSKTERRVFVSPTLEAGQEYYYTLTAEIKGAVKTERVSVRAGQEVNVKIEFPASVAAK